MIVAIAIVIAVTIPVLFLLLLRRFDLYRTGKFIFNIATLVGGLMAYYLAAQINPAIVNAGWLNWTQVSRITAPILEEILKSVILIYLVSRADFNYVVDGALYGFGAGIGFAIIENIEYINGHAEIALLVAVARVFSTNLVHATGSGLIGTALAYHRGDSSSRGWTAILAGYAIAIGIHATFNTMVSAGAYLLFAVAYGVAGVALIWYMIKRGMKTQKEWVAEKLGMADRVTQEETKVVSNIETVNEVLSLVENQFGAEKVSLVRNLIYKQAEMGIKRKLLESTSSESRKNEITKIIEELSKDMNDLRIKIGSYCMMMVREVYLGQDAQIWNLLNARIAAAGFTQKGGGLWDRVTERVKQSPTQEEKP